MRILIVLAMALATAAACGPKNTPAPVPPDPPEGNGGAAGTAGPPSPAEKPKPLSRAECEQMIDHVLDVGLAQQRANKAPEHVPTKEQVAAIRERLVADQLSACLAWSRSQWDCVMASTTVETLYACAEEPAPGSSGR
jgi:hypothetical protein